MIFSAHLYKILERRGEAYIILRGSSLKAFKVGRGGGGKSVKERGGLCHAKGGKEAKQGEGDV